MTETQLSKAILEAVNAIPGVRLWRQPAGGYRGRSVGVPAGTPDLAGYAGRYFIGIEVKTEERLKDTTSKTYLAQLEWRERAYKDGAMVHVVTSAQEAVALVLNLRNESGIRGKTK